MVIKNCLICEKDIIRKNISFSDWSKRKYCSHKCYSVSKLGVPSHNKGKPAPWAIGNKHGVGHTPWNKDMKGIHLSPETEFKKGVESRAYKGGKPKCKDCDKQLTRYNRNRCQKCYGLSIRGENAPTWKGGKPSCLDCNKKLERRESSRCRKCNIVWKRNTPENNPNYKGGISKTPGYKNNIKRKSRLNTVGSHTGKEWTELKAKYGFMCLCCKKEEPYIKLTEDHIIPLTKGGSDNIENIQPLCQSCNSRKHTTIFDYRISFNSLLNNA